MPEERFDDHLRPVPRVPSPGIAAVLSAFVPGLGHVYAGRMGAGLLWFLATGLGYWAIVIPGFLIHVASIYYAYKAAKYFQSY